MACTVHVAWDERLTDYHFGPDHPMAPIRVELTMRLQRALLAPTQGDGERLLIVVSQISSRSRSGSEGAGMRLTQVQGRLHAVRQRRAGKRPGEPGW
jgi:hypothetical protein